MFLNGAHRKGDWCVVLTNLSNYFKTCNLVKKRLQDSCHKKEATESVIHRLGVLKNFANFIPLLESLFNKVTGLKTCSFIKKKLQHRCFPVKFPKFLRTPSLQNTFFGYF